MRIAVFLSGGGTNLQSLLDTFAADTATTIGLVVSDRLGAGGLDRARAAGVPTHVLADPTDGAAIVTELGRHDIDAVILAGYLKLVPESVVEQYAYRMINIHPALLPSFGGPGMYGRRVHEAVLAAGATVSGATVHLASAEYDRGPILAQWPVPVHAHDTPDDLAARVLEAEHRLLPAVVRAADPDGRFRRFTPHESHYTLSSEPPSIETAGHP